MVLPLSAQDYEACCREVEKEQKLSFSNKCKYACSLFHQICKFQQSGLLCDTVMKTGRESLPVKVHKIVLMSAKSFDSDYYSDRESIESESDNDEVFSSISCSNSSVFEDAYHSESEEDSMLAEQMETINLLRQKGECCDVILEAPGLSYQAHKVVLAASSEYFKLMFTSSMKEKQMKVINLDIAKQLDVSQLPFVLDYIYTGQIDLDDDTIFPTLCLSCYFQIYTLTDRCQTYLLNQVAEANCCGFYVLAKCFALDRLKAIAGQYIHDHFPEIEGISQDLNMLEREEMKNYIQSDCLGQSATPSKNNETRVLGNVMAWLEQVKYQFADELLSHVRFSLVPKDVIQSHCRDCEKQDDAPKENVRSVKTCLQKALDYHGNLYEQPLMQSKSTQLRTSKRNWVCLDGVLAPKAIRLPALSDHVISPEDELDDSMQKIRDPFHSVVVLHGFVYVMGGTRQTAIGYSNEVARYDSRLDTWLKVAPMNECRGDFYACSIGNYIYVFGGRNKCGPMSSCERYDPEKNLWERISDLPESLYMMAGEVEGGNVYISGGFNDFDAVGTMFRYSPTSDEWEDIPAYMFKDRGYHVMLNDGDGHLWVIGGVDNPFSGRNVWEVERFDIEHCMWSYVGQVLAVQPFLSIQRLNAFRDEDGRICVFAVTNTDNSPMMKYNLAENLWEVMEHPIDYFEIKSDSN